MNDAPIVSIIMGIYNCESTLKKAVECIVNQTFTDWELIMCDDCSSDNTYAVATKLAQNDSRIRVLKNNKNMTLAPTLNKCLQIARGKYIARMDGDDICDFTRIEKEYLFLENHKEYSIVSCLMDIYDDSGVYGNVKYKEKPQKKDLLKKSPFCHAGCMVRTEAIQTVGGYSESMKYKRVEDYDLWVRMYKAGFIGYNIQQSLYYMYDDRNAISRRTLKGRINEARVKKNIIKWFSLNPYNYVYMMIPIIKALIPEKLYIILHKYSHK